MLNGDIIHILFEDEAMIRDYQAIEKTWFLKGQQKIIPTYGKHQGVKLLGTLNYETGKVFVMENESYNAEVFLSFLKAILEKYPQGKIALILDNAKIHHAKLIQPFLKENKHRLELHSLRTLPILIILRSSGDGLRNPVFIMSFSHRQQKSVQLFRHLLKELTRCPKLL